MAAAIRTADSKGRVVLPGFANATVIVEALSDTEYRIRKARVIAEDDLRMPEDDMPIKLTEREAKKVLDMIENPPKPNAALRRAAKRYRKNYG
jgi:uncharacterized protein (DUF1778 family)